MYEHTHEHAFSKQNTLTGLQGPQVPAQMLFPVSFLYWKIHTIQTIQNSLLLFMQKYCQKTFFPILFDDTHHLSCH